MAGACLGLVVKKELLHVLCVFVVTVSPSPIWRSSLPHPSLAWPFLSLEKHMESILFFLLHRNSGMPSSCSWSLSLVWPDQGSLEAEGPQAHSYI